MDTLNIFSKTKTKEKKNIKITVDHREKNSLVVPELVALGFDIEFKQLPVADYIVNNIAIERKTILDLQSSIINKRIMRQLKELQQYPVHALLIEGIEYHDPYNGILHPNAYRGFLLSTAIEYNIPLIFTYNEQDTAHYLKVLANKRKKPEPSLRATKIFLTEKEQLQFIIEGFPQIGPKTAKKLLEKYKTLRKISNASKKDLEKVIGKKSEVVHKLLNKIYR